jgi:hypothetical protein
MNVLSQQPSDSSIPQKQAYSIFQNTFDTKKKGKVHPTTSHEGRQ